MPPKKYEILLDNVVIDTTYSYLSFDSKLSLYNNMYGNRITTRITNLINK